MLSCGTRNGVASPLRTYGTCTRGMGAPARRWSVSEPEADDDAPRMTLSLANAAEARHALQDKTMEALYYTRFLRAKRHKLQAGQARTQGRLPGAAHRAMCCTCSSGVPLTRRTGWLLALPGSCIRPAFKDAAVHA